MQAALPPSSSTTFFLPAFAFNCQPTAGEPVKLSKTGKQPVQKPAEREQIEVLVQDGGGAGCATERGKEGTADETGFSSEPAHEQRSRHGGQRGADNDQCRGQGDERQMRGDPKRDSGRCHHKETPPGARQHLAGAEHEDVLMVGLHRSHRIPNINPQKMPRRQKARACKPE